MLVVMGHTLCARDMFLALAEDDIIRGCLPLIKSFSGQDSAGQGALTHSNIGSSAEVMRSHVDMKRLCRPLCAHNWLYDRYTSSSVPGGGASSAGPW